MGPIWMIFSTLSKLGDFSLFNREGRSEQEGFFSSKKQFEKEATIPERGLDGKDLQFCCELLWLLTWLFSSRNKEKRGEEIQSQKIPIEKLKITKTKKIYRQ